MRILVKVLLSLLVATIALAENPPPRIQDEGGTLAPYFNLNCVGSNITCSTSGVNATVTVPLPSSLAANGANCSAGNYPLGVDAAGAAESCTVDDDVPESGDLAAATLQVVTTNGQTTSVGATMLDDANLTFGTAGNVTIDYDTGSGYCKATNVLSSDSTKFQFYDLPIDLYYDATDVGGLPVGAQLATYRNTVDMSVYGLSNAVTLGRTSSAYNNSQSAAALYNYLSFQNPNSATGTTLWGLRNTIQQTAAGSVSSMYGIEGTVSTSSATATNGTIQGIRSVTTTNATNTEVSSFAVGNVVFSGAGTTTNYYGLKLLDPAVTGALTNSYGIYIPSWTGGTNRYPVWLDVANKIHFREAGTSIHSSAAGQLDLTAATKVKINTAQLETANYSFPLADGSASQYLKTNGAGATSFDTLTLSDITDYSNSSSTTEMLFNNAGAIDGTSFFTTDGTNLDLTSGDLRLDDNVDLSFGTGDDATIYYDGTDLIIDSTLVGTGVTRLKSDSSGDIVLDKIGLGGSVISGSYFINLVQSGNARGAMSFDYTTTGTNILSDLFLKVTSQRTNNSPNYAILTQTIKDEDKQSSYYGMSATWGTKSTRSITTAGTVTFVGYNADHSLGTGTANTTGDILQYGLRVLPFSNYTGVASQTDWGIFSGEDIALASDEKMIYEGNTTTKGDTYHTYDSTDTDLELTVDGTQIADYDNDQIDYAVPIQQDACRSGFTRFGLGCIQTDEEGNGTWDVAREDCYDTYGGRLPTPHELMIAANNLTLTNETDDEEWTDEINYDAAAVECGYLKLNAGTADESADYADEACGTSEAYRCFVPFAGGI